MLSGEILARSAPSRLSAIWPRPVPNLPGHSIHQYSRLGAELEQTGRGQLTTDEVGLYGALLRPYKSL